MLSRYRSPSGLALPRTSRVAGFNNPVQQFEDSREFRLQCLRERTSGLGPDSMATELRLWDGPLAGIAHVAGQFAALEEGPAAEAARQPPEEIAEALSADLELLMSLADTTQDVLYDAGGSESDFALLPIILEPRPRPPPTATQGMVNSLDSAGAGAAAESCLPQDPGTQAAAPSAMAAAAAATAAQEAEVSGGMGNGGGGGWWRREEVLAAPLTWGEVAVSLGVTPELATQMQPPLEFNDSDAFLSHMTERHIRKLAGGEEHPPWQPKTGAASPAAAAAGSAAAAAGDAAGTGDVMAAAPVSAAAALAAAVQRLDEAVCYPVLQVMLGSEALGWNPIPLMWLGRSRQSGAVIGLLTAVVWT